MFISSDRRHKQLLEEKLFISSVYNKDTRIRSISGTCIAGFALDTQNRESSGPTALKNGVLVLGKFLGV